MAVASAGIAAAGGTFERGLDPAIGAGRRNRIGALVGAVRVV